MRCRDLIARDSLALRLFGRSDSVPMVVYDTLGCSNVSLAAMDSLLAFLYAGRPVPVDSLRRMKRREAPCALRYDAGLSNLSTTTDSSALLFFLPLDSALSGGHYLATAMLLRGARRRGEPGKPGRTHDGAIWYLIVLDRQGRLVRLSGEPQRR